MRSVVLPYTKTTRTSFPSHFIPHYSLSLHTTRSLRLCTCSLEANLLQLTHIGQSSLHPIYTPRGSKHLELESITLFQDQYPLYIALTADRPSNLVSTHTPHTPICSTTPKKGPHLDQSPHPRKKKRQYCPAPPRGYIADHHTVSSSLLSFIHIPITRFLLPTL